MLSWLWNCLIFLLQSAAVAKTWIVCEFVASLKFEYEVVAKAWIKHEVVAKALNLSMRLSRIPLCYKCSLRLWKKNYPDLAPILCEKKFRPGPKTQAPPPPRISNGPCLNNFIVLILIIHVLWYDTREENYYFIRKVIVKRTMSSNDLERSDTKLDASSFPIEYKIFCSTFYAKPYINRFRND